ncbi:cytosine/adenosine deaminase-related metal-dependent hydrolase [Cupriavidus alkaliphilus]|uniref:Cytosine/adenosine deaminase-related metal-dependent hydrolase n=1 Tax=Cupriavidus alkaliphilus TaxID=942866 RepID=A0A7W4YTZ2_9BURK|nr:MULTISPECIES: hypothetical protein [Cupriavidus]MBB3009957.1 cytosine/adenosine deaminase-related metal-dependent hydrolase [Cupriavidus alkaliphilus]
MMLIDQAITASMPQSSILDVLTEMEQWLNLHRLFGPLSSIDPGSMTLASELSARCSATLESGSEPDGSVRQGVEPQAILPC